MNDYIKNRITMHKQGFKDGEIDEKYAGGLWDWAGDIVKPINHEGYEHLAEEIQTEIYYALSEVFNNFNKGSV